MTFHLRLCTPDKTFFNAPADGIVCPGLGGYFGVLVHHRPMISGLGTGVLKVMTRGKANYFVLDGGMAEVNENTVELFANAVFPVDSTAQAEEKIAEIKTQRRIPIPYA